MEAAADFSRPLASVLIIASVGGFDANIGCLAAQSAPAGKIEGLGKLPGLVS